MVFMHAQGCSGLFLRMALMLLSESPAAARALAEENYGLDVFIPELKNYFERFPYAPGPSGSLSRLRHGRDGRAYSNGNQSLRSVYFQVMEVQLDLPAVAEQNGVSRVL